MQTETPTRPRRPYQKPRLQECSLSRTPKVWRLLQAVKGERLQGTDLFTETCRLAYYAAALAQDMPMAEGPISPLFSDAPTGDPLRVDFGADVLTDRGGRLASINICAGRALNQVVRGCYSPALVVVRDILTELGQREEKKELDREPIAVL